MFTAKEIDSNFKQAIMEDQVGSHGFAKDVMRTIQLHQTIALIKIAYELERIGGLKE